MSEALLAFAAANQFKLFPVTTDGHKRPATGGENWKHVAVRSYVLDWERAITAGLGLAVYAAGSRVLIIDVDVKHLGRDQAWNRWYAIAGELGIDPLRPHVFSPSGGWHYHIKIPPNNPPLRGLLRMEDESSHELISIRYEGYAVAVAPGYSFSPEPLQTASPELLGLMKPERRRRESLPAEPSQYDRAEVESMIRYVASVDGWCAREDWLTLGMGLRLSFGDAGLPLWWLSDNGTMKPEDERQWDAFATSRTADHVTLASSFRHARKLGYQSPARTAA